MKHLLTTALIAAACTLGAAAQSVTVTDADGNSTKFPASRVKDITFTKVENPDPGVTVFDNIKVDPYSRGDAELDFSTEGMTLHFWVQGPSGANYLNDGVYTGGLNATAAMTYDTNTQYSYFTDATHEKGKIESGTLTVSHTGTEYTITFDLVLEDLGEYKAMWKGSLGTYGETIELDPVNVIRTSVNGAKDGQYRLRFNDKAYNYEMTIDFFGTPGTTELPAGEYYQSEGNEPFTIGPASDISFYRPNFSEKFGPASYVVVTNEGEEYTFDFHLTLESGRPAIGKLTYKVNWTAN